MKTMCVQFNCDRRKGNFCCASCGYRTKCKNPCLNSPDKCRLSKEAAPGRKLRKGGVVK